jgi:hypothetical protein
MSDSIQPIAPAARSRTYDPATGVGWPRPLVPWSAEGAALPRPYIASTVTTRTGEYFDGAAMDTDRAEAIYQGWLCQVCGEPAEATAYAPIAARHWAQRDQDPALTVSGGPLCSARCSRLALRVCPDFHGHGVVISFARTAAQWSPHGDTEFTVSVYDLVDTVTPATGAVGRTE